MSDASARAGGGGVGAVSAGWFPDPSGRFQWRWFDGRVWTPHVASGAWQGVDPPLPGPTAPLALRPQVSGFGSAPVAPPSGTVFDGPSLLVLRQVGTPTAAAQDPEGHWLALLRPVASSELNQTVATLTQSNRYRTRQFELVDTADNVLLKLDVPAAVFTGQVVVKDPRETEIGRIVQYDAEARYFTFETFSLLAAASPRTVESAATVDLVVVDAGRRPVASLVFGPQPAPDVPAPLTLARTGPLEDPMRSLVVAFALSFDLAFGTGRCGVG